MNEMCIMSEMPYCPACPHSHIIVSFDDYDNYYEEWICMLTGEKVK